MKNKLIISLFVIVLLVVGFLWLLHNGERSKSVLSLQTANTNAPLVENVVQPNASVQQMDTNANAAPMPPGQVTPQVADSASAEEKLRAEIEAKNVPLEFYGRVIDQDSNPLSGVKINARVRHWSPGSFGSIRVDKETDTDGRFDINGVTGDGFSIESISKEGYEPEPGQSNFGPMEGSLSGPVIFKMWSTNIHEQLITGGTKLQIIPDGRPYVIDLTKGTIAESGSGDLKVWIKYENQVVRGQVYDWSCEIDAINGGLLEQPLGTAMYVASAEGYVPTFQFQQQIKGGQRGSIGARQFYVKLNDGQKYARITIELYAPFNDEIPGLIRLSYAINPSGSRILR